jgi:hypothetical protein
MPLHMTLADAATVIRRHGKSCTIPLSPHPSPLAPKFSPRHVPLETVLYTEHQQHRIGQGDECPRCTKPVAGGAIVQDKPTFNMEFGTFTALRRIYCNGCRCIWWALLSCNISGSRVNDVLQRGHTDGHSKAGQATIEAFLRKYPEARGVADVVQ